MLTTDLNFTAAALKQGGVAAFPTETVYGLGALAFMPEAVARIYEIKQRPLSHPLIVHIADPMDIENIVTHVPPLAKKLIQKFWPGALTLVLPKKQTIPEIVSGGLSSVGVRCPSHPIARELIRLAGMPIAAPSANLFGNLSTTSALHVEESLGNLVDCVLDGGASEVGVESTIVSFLKETPELLRPGGITQEELEAVIGSVTLPVKNAKAIAPGMLESHYSPRTKLLFQNQNATLPSSLNLGLLCLQKPEDTSRFSTVEELSPSKNLREAGVRLYEALYRLDKKNLDLIIAYEFPHTGLGRAINDRLQRASIKN